MRLVGTVLVDQDVCHIIAASHSVKPQLRGGNSTISRVEYDGSTYAVKNYSERSDGGRRLLQEYAGLDLGGSIVGIYAAILMLWCIFIVLKTMNYPLNLNSS